MRGSPLHRIRLILCLAFLAIPLANRIAARPLLAQAAPPVLYLHYNTDLDLDSSGVLHVRILQQIGFGDEFSSAFFDIPKAFTADIQNVRVLAATTLEGHRDPATAQFAPIPASVTDALDHVAVEWSYPRTSPGDIRSFMIEYDAVGAVWLYPDGDFLSWNAVNADRSGVPVQSSTVRLTLPPEVPLNTTTFDEHGPSFVVEQQGQTLVFTATEPIPDGLAFEVEAHFPHDLIAAEVQDWQRIWDADKLSVVIERFQSAMTIGADGVIHVEETTDLRIDRGTLHQGYHTISLLYVDDVTNIRVSQDGVALTESADRCNGCFVVSRMAKPQGWVYYDPEQAQTIVQEDNSGRVSLDWYTDARQSPAPTTIHISYDLIGSLRITPDSQLLVWPVTPDYSQSIQQASLRIQLPPGVSADDVTVEGPARQGAPQVAPDNTLSLVYDGPVDRGAWSIALTLPGGATSAAPPQWQAKFESVIAEADAAAVSHARSLLLQRFLGVLTLVGTGLAVILAWMRRGRTLVHETLRGYVSEPPAPLSPAMVAHLIDRKVNENGILGSIFHLATVGALEIDLGENITLRRRRAEPIGATRTLPDAYGNPVPMDYHLAYLFDTVLLPVVPQDQAISLDAIGPTLRSHLPELYAQLGRDVQMYFIDVPNHQGRVPRIFWIVLFGLLISFVLLGWLSILVAAAIAFFGAIVMVGFFRADAPATYSDQGALETDRWLRFKNYLVDLRRYSDQAAAQEILDRYFGYAVALGIEQVVLSQAEILGAGSPLWMPLPSSTSSPSSSSQWPPRPGRRPRLRPSLGHPLGLPRPQPSAPQPRPSLAGMSERLGSNLSRAGSDLGALLSTAAGSAENSPRTVVLNSRLRRREMSWQPGTSVNKILDDILKQSISDARELRARVEAKPAPAESHDGPGKSESSWSDSSSSRSSGGFGHSSSSSSRASSPSSSSRSSSSSSSSRSGGGGRSGFR